VAEKLHLSLLDQRVEGPLYGTLAGSQRKRQRGAGPSLTIGKQSKDLTMLSLDRPREHDDIASLPRHEGEPALRRADICNPPKGSSEPPDLDPQARAM
jgi:hypothetical protein